MAVSLTGDLTSLLICISCGLFLSASVPDVIDAHSGCANEFLCMTDMNVWVYFGTCYCRCEGGSIGEGVCC